MKKLIIVVIVIVAASFSCEQVDATSQECASLMTLAEAVKARDLAWNQVLVCENNPQYRK